MNVIHVFNNKTAATFALLEATKHERCEYSLTRRTLTKLDGSVHRYVSQHDDPIAFYLVAAVVEFHCQLEPSTSDAWVALRDAHECFRVTS